MSASNKLNVSNLSIALDKILRKMYKLTFSDIQMETYFGATSNNLIDIGAAKTSEPPTVESSQ